MNLWIRRRWAPAIAIGALLALVLFSPRAWWPVVVPIGYAGLVTWAGYNLIRHRRHRRRRPPLAELLDLERPGELEHQADRAELERLTRPADLFGSMDRGAEWQHRAGYQPLPAPTQTAGPGVAPSLTAPGPASNGHPRHKKERDR